MMLGFHPYRLEALLDQVEKELIMRFHKGDVFQTPV
jgi:hypothetical protein